MWEQFKNFYLPQNSDTWKVAINELTWLLRSISLNSKIYVNKNGNVVISHEFGDVLICAPQKMENEVLSMIWFV